MRNTWRSPGAAAALIVLLTFVAYLPALHGRVRWKDFLCSAPFCVLSVALGLMTVWLQYHRDLKGQSVGADGFLGRLAVAGSVPWFYLHKVLPVGCLTFRESGGLGGRPLQFGLGYFVVTLR
jgi:hypothetical protein